MYMIIQASHMNTGFMQKLRAQQEQGTGLGSTADLLQDSAAAQLGNGLSVDERAGLTPQAVPLDQNPALTAENRDQGGQEPAPLTIGATVANEVLRRLEQGTAGEGGEEPRDDRDLRHSLGQSLDWIRQRFGDDAGSAAAGMVVSSTANGVTEDSLGDGLLDVARFIDRNYGTAAGDDVIATFNANVNVALNDYFDNGSYETFHAVSAADDGPQAIAARFFARAVQTDSTSVDQVDPNQQLLDDLRKELDNVAELQGLATQLEADFNPAKATPEAAIAAYTDQSAPSRPLFADIAV